MIRAAVGVVIALTGVLLWLAAARHDAKNHGAGTDLAGTPPAAESRASRLAAAPRRPALDPSVLPASLRQTRVDGRLTASAGGELEVSHQVLRLFDYFLSSRGELTVQEIRGLVEAQTRTLPARAADGAMTLFDTYVDWQVAVADVANESLAPRDYLARVVELQHEYFGDRAEALFGRRNLIARVSLDRQDHPDDASALDARLPARIRRGLTRMRAPHDVRARVAAMRARGATDQDIWHVRARVFGAAAADRLAALDRTRR